MKNDMETVNGQKNNNVWSGDIFDGPYYIINKRLLSFIGQWPYQLRRERNAKFLFILLVGCSGLGPQIRALVIGWGKLDHFVASMAPLVANAGCLMMLINSQFYSSQMRKILDQTRMNWERLRTSPKLKILQKHGEIGRLYTQMYTIESALVVTGWIMTPLVPKILEVVAPLNHSRSRIDMFPADYGIDPDKYFWVIFFHLGPGLIIVLSVLVAIDVLYMTIAQHACGMFEVLRYDLEDMLQQNDAANDEVILHPEYHADVFFHNIVSCIKRHKNLLEYVRDIQSTCQWMLFMIVGASIVLLSFTGYQTVAKSTPREDVVRMAMFTVAQTFHLFCISLPGHWISSESSLFPDSVYSCKWYMMSVRSRKLIILFIRASIHPCGITAGKIYDMSLENFCGVLQVSMSYLTMLTSFQ